MTFDKISYGILLAAVFLIPIFFVPAAFISTQFGTSLLFAFSVIAAALIYIVAALQSGAIDLPEPSKYILGFTALVPVIYTLAGIANGFSRMTFLGYTFDESTVGFIVLGFIYLFLVSVLFRSKIRIFYSYLAFLFSSVILSLFLLIRIIFGAGVLSFGVFSDLTQTMIGSFNNVGIFFGITAIMSLLTYQMVKGSTFMKVLLSLALLLSLFFLALVNFTMIWIILAVTALLYILWTMFSTEVSPRGETSVAHRFKKIPLYPAIVLIVSIIFIIWGGSLGSFLSNKLNVTNVEVRPTLAVTLDIARNTLKSQPLFGSGPNTFVSQWLQYRPDDIISTIFWNTDFTNGIGLIPTFAVTTGLLGVLSWLVFLGFYLYVGMKSLFVRIEDSFTKYLIVSSFFVSLYLWIMAFAYVPSTVIFILTFFFTGLFFASIYAADLVPVTVRQFGRHARQGFVVSLILVGCFISGTALAYGLVRNSQSLWYFQKSSYALNTSGDIVSAENYMNQAIAAVPYDVYYRSLAQIEVAKMNAILNQDQSKVSQDTIQKEFKDTLTNAVTAGLAARDADPSNYLNWLSLGDVYAAVSPTNLGVSGAYQSAQLAYAQALQRNPKNPAILLTFARLAVGQNDLKTATNFVQQAISIKPNYLDAYFLLSQIQVTSKDIPGAIQSVAAASVLSPTDAGILFQLGLLKYNVGDYAGAIAALEKATSLTPDYANAKYFLGLSYEATAQHDKAIAEFTDLSKTNPDNKQVATILTNLEAGKPPFPSTTSNPAKAKKLPVKEQVQ